MLSDTNADSAGREKANWLFTECDTHTPETKYSMAEKWGRYTVTLVVLKQKFFTLSFTEEI